MRVDEGTQGWEDEEAMMFDDSFTHAMWSGEGGETVLLVIDLWHPELSPSDIEKITAVFPCEPLPERVELMQAVLCNPSLALEIAARLDVQSVGLASRSCLAWADTARDLDLWEWQCVRASVCREAELGWKESFKEAHSSRFTECVERGEDGRLRFDFICKTMLFGDSGAGKTSFLLRLMDGTFSTTYMATIGIDFRIRTVRCGDASVKLQVWDNQPVPRFRLRHSTVAYRGTHIALVLYDSTDRRSFEQVALYLQEAQEHASEHCHIGIVACKCDLIAARQVSSEEGAALAGSWAERFPHGVRFGETSSKTGEGVEKALAVHVRRWLRAGSFAPQRPKIIAPPQPSCSRCCLC
jgi:GTPase SAR1 family protein